jgi:tetratricopeptide (TPR) repeat protein
MNPLQNTPFFKFSPLFMGLALLTLSNTGHAGRGEDFLNQKRPNGSASSVMPDDWLENTETFSVLKEALGSRKENRREAAREPAREAAKPAERVDTFSVFLKQAQAQMSLGEFAEADKIHQAMLALKQTPLQTALLLRQRAGLSSRQGEHPQAHAWWSQALLKFEGEKAGLEADNTRWGWAMGYVRQGGLGATKAANQQCEGIKGNNPWVGLFNLLCRVDVLQSTSQIQASMKLLKSQPVTKSIGQSEYLYRLVGGQMALGLYAEAESTLKRLQGLSDQQDGGKANLSVQESKAWVLLRKGLYEEAQRQMQKNEAEAEAQGETLNLLSMQSDRAFLLLRQNQAPEAVKLLESIVAQYTAMKHPHALALNLERLGWAHIENKQYAKAFPPLQQARSFFEDVGLTAAVAAIDMDLGYANLGLQQWQSAEKQFNSAAANGSNNDFPENMIFLYGGLQKLYIGQNRTDKALEVGLKAIEANQILRKNAGSNEKILRTDYKLAIYQQTLTLLKAQGRDAEAKRIQQMIDSHDQSKMDERPTPPGLKKPEGPVV